MPWKDPNDPRKKASGCFRKRQEDGIRKRQTKHITTGKGKATRMRSAATKGGRASKRGSQKRGSQKYVTIEGGKL
jgi:hypothetical protein